MTERKEAGSQMYRNKTSLCCFVEYDAKIITKKTSFKTHQKCYENPAKNGQKLKKNDENLRIVLKRAFKMSLINFPSPYSCL